MKIHDALIAATALISFATFAAEESADDVKIRQSIPLGGDFKPQPKVGAFVVVGHGGRIIVSKDDGVTWKQAFFAAPGADHGPWATKAIAYTNGVFAVPVGWGAATIYLASDDALNWRHLTNGTAKLPESKGDARVMPGAWGIAGGKGIFVTGGYMTFNATADLGKTFDVFGMWGAFKDDPRGKLSTHHVGVVYCGDASGRFLALGDNRGKDGAKFGHLFASDDNGKMWQWIAPKGLEASTGRGTLKCNGRLLVMTDKDAVNAWTSADAGETWDGPHATGTQRATLSVVRSEFWLCGKNPAPAATAKRGVTYQPRCRRARSLPVTKARLSASIGNDSISSAARMLAKAGRKFIVTTRPRFKAALRVCAMELLDWWHRDSNS